jgi:riboflavin synthase
MFTGIIEAIGTIVQTEQQGSNVTLTIQSPISNELKIDQSVAHNGVCLTVIAVQQDTHQVTAIEETLQKTTLGTWRENTQVNLERCTQVGARLDGHIVQGHVDQTGVCIGLTEQDGSWLYTFRYVPSRQNIVVEKGSICVNGTSLTAFDAEGDTFKVAIIPYTYEHTTIHAVKVGSRVNLEFDIVGKYVAKMMEGRFSEQ